MNQLVVMNQYKMVVVRALVPLAKTLRFVGFVPFTINDGHPPTGCICARKSWIVYSVGIYLTAMFLILMQEILCCPCIYNAMTMNSLGVLIYTGQMVMNNVSTLVTLYESFWRSKHHRRFYAELLELETVLKERILIMDRIPRQSYIVMYVFVVLAFFVLPDLLGTVLYYINDDLEFVIFRISYAVHYFMYALKIVYICICVLSLRDILQTVCKNYKEKLDVGCQVTEQEFEVLQQTFVRMRRLFESINESFGWTLLIGMLSDAFYVASSVFIVFYSDEQKRVVPVSMLLAIVPHLVSIVGLAVVCSRTTSLVGCVFFK